MKKKEYRVFIPGNVPSSKNSMVTNTKTGRQFPSKLCSKYYKATDGHWASNCYEFRRRWDTLSKPWVIYFHFHRNSRHKYDWINPAQTVQDRMVKHGWIEDDNISEMIPFPLMLNEQWSTYDPEHPGVTIYITNIPHRTINIRNEHLLI